MPFNADSFRKEAKSAGYSDEEIQSVIDSESVGVKPIDTPPTLADVQVGNKYDYLAPAAGALAIGGAAVAGKKVYDSLKDKMADQPRIEPTLDGTTRVPGEPSLDLKALNPDVSVKQAPAAKPTFEQLREKLGLPVENLTADDLAYKKAVEESDLALKRIEELEKSLLPKPNTPAAAVAAELAVTPSNEPALEPVKPPETKVRRKPGVAPEGTTLRTDLGPGDNTLFNTYGEEGRKEILKKYNDGKPAGTYENAQAIQAKMLAEQSTPGRRELPRSIASERGIPPTGAGNFGKLGTAIKVGGVAGLALTAAQMAQAAEEARKGNFAPATETGFNLLGMIPGIGTLFNAATFSQGLGENETEELRKKIYQGKVGAGRGSQGVPPPTR